MTPRVPGAAGTPAAQRPWRWREREWGWIALGCVAAGVPFSLWPELDLWLGSTFRAAGGFAGNDSAGVRVLYQAVPWLGRALVLAALGVALQARWQPRRALPLRWRRPLLALGLSLVLGVGVVVNLGLKEQWGRARPGQVAELGGTAVFTPALRPAAHCASNCSFVSGHAATGFALMSLGLLGSPRTRRRWLVVGAAAGLVVGLARMAQGGHFASDVLFAGLAVWASHAALRQGWLVAVAWRRHARRRMGAQPARSRASR